MAKEGYTKGFRKGFFTKPREAFTCQVKSKRTGRNIISGRFILMTGP